VRLFCGRLAAFTFWGWQAVIVLASVTLPLGITQGKEYAELEWPIDLLIAVVWIAYAVVFIGTIARRRVRHIYVANWFFAAAPRRFCLSRLLLPEEVSYSPSSSLVSA